MKYYTNTERNSVTQFSDDAAGIVSIEDLDLITEDEARLIGEQNGFTVTKVDGGLSFTFEAVSE